MTCSVSTAEDSSKVIRTGGWSRHAKVCTAAFSRALPFLRNVVSAKVSGAMPSSLTRERSGSTTPVSRSISAPCVPRQMGNRGELVRVYKRCCAVLRSTLSVEPSFETRTLYSRVRSTVRSAQGST